MASRNLNTKANPPPHKSTMPKTIPLMHGLVSIVDDGDFEIVRGLKWKAYKSSKSQSFYARLHVRENGKYRTVLMHRLLMNAKDGQEIDHIDNNGLNNQRANLRFSTREQNMRNRPPNKNNKSGYKGVSFYKGKYDASIRHEGSRYKLGHFTSPAEAARAYDAKAKELFGDFAYLNFSEKAKSAA